MGWRINHPVFAPWSRSSRVLRCCGQTLSSAPDFLSGALLIDLGMVILWLLVTQKIKRTSSTHLFCYMILMDRKFSRHKKTEQRYSLAHAQLITNLWHLFLFREQIILHYLPSFASIYLSIFVFLCLYFCTSLYFCLSQIFLNKKFTNIQIKHQLADNVN